MRNPDELKVFQKAHELAKEVYRLTTMFPSEEKFELVRQIRRSSVSIASNLAEGCSSRSDKDFRRFVEIALGSAVELEYQLKLAKELAQMGVLRMPEAPGSRNGFEAFSKIIAPVGDKASEVSKMLVSFEKSLWAES